MLDLQSAQGDLAVTDDDGEQVVEVVGHAAGQLADDLHLLSLAELLLQPVPFRQIDPHPDQAGSPAHEESPEARWFSAKKARGFHRFFRSLL